MAPIWPPFERETPEELWEAHLTAALALPDRVPAELAAVLLRCLAKEPAARFQSVTEVAAALAATAAAGAWDEARAEAWWREHAVAAPAGPYTEEDALAHTQAAGPAASG